jgi:hypothetical protein
MMGSFLMGFALLQTVLHEYVETGAAEVSKAPVISEGKNGRVPGEIEQDGQLISPPHAGPRSEGRESRFLPDRDTGTAAPRQGGVEPFAPALGPFARVSVLDRVDASYALVVGDAKLAPVPAAVPPGPDRMLFYGRVELRLRRGVAVPIPSPAPGLRLHAAELRVGEAVRHERVEILRDGAENLYARAAVDGARTLVYLVDAPRSYFEGPVPPDVTTDEVPRALVPTVPGSVRASAERALARMGASLEERSVSRLLGQLVPYFRSFIDGARPAGSADSRDVYWDLVTGQRGVCRHRAFAFVVTAQAVGLPARLVLSDVHAFAEVMIPHVGWRRIDLGGARMDLPPERHATGGGVRARADDPFPQPPSYRARSAGSMVAPTASMSASASAKPTASASASAGTSTTTTTTTTIELEVPAVQDSRRGDVIEVRGRARSAGSEAAGIVVDVYLRALETPRSVWIASAVTDAQGRFYAQGNIPRQVAGGEHQLIVQARGDR